MGTLIYGTNCSIDGYTEDASGAFDWGASDDEVHSFWDGLMAGVGTQLLGRRMYETMAVWETDPSFGAASPVHKAFADAWIDSEKIVYSRTMSEPVTARTRIARSFDPAEVRSLQDASTRDLLVGGPELAAQALRAGLVDEIHLVLNPIALGAGKPALPTDLRLDLDLVDQRRFSSSGTVHVAYRVRRSAG